MNATLLLRQFCTHVSESSPVQDYISVKNDHLEIELIPVRVENDGRVAGYTGQVSCRKRKSQFKFSHVCLDDVITKIAVYLLQYVETNGHLCE
jgi:hypothetical protein